MYLLAGAQREREGEGGREGGKERNVFKGHGTASSYPSIGREGLRYQV